MEIEIEQTGWVTYTLALGKHETGEVVMNMTWNALANRIIFVALALFGAALIQARACDTWVALADSTANHSIILAKNSDRPPMEAQVLVQFPHERHAPGATVHCTYIDIPQVAETYEHLGSKLWWAFGAAGPK